MSQSDRMAYTFDYEIVEGQKPKSINVSNVAKYTLLRRALTKLPKDTWLGVKVHVTDPKMLDTAVNRVRASIGGWAGLAKLRENGLAYVVQSEPRGDGEAMLFVMITDASNKYQSVPKDESEYEYISR